MLSRVERWAFRYEAVLLQEVHGFREDFISAFRPRSASRAMSFSPGRARDTGDVAVIVRSGRADSIAQVAEIPGRSCAHRA